METPKGRNDTGSSRPPFRHARRCPPHLAVLRRPGFVRAAPALPGTTRIRLPSASPPCCDRTEAKVSHLHSNNSASRRSLEAVEKLVTDRTVRCVYCTTALLRCSRFCDPGDVVQVAVVMGTSGHPVPRTMLSFGPGPRSAQLAA